LLATFSKANIFSVLKQIDIFMKEDTKEKAL